MNTISCAVAVLQKEILNVLRSPVLTAIEFAICSFFSVSGTPLNCRLKCKITCGREGSSSQCVKKILLLKAKEFSHTLYIYANRNFQGEISQRFLISLIPANQEPGTEVPGTEVGGNTIPPLFSEIWEISSSSVPKCTIIRHDV